MSFTCKVCGEQHDGFPAWGAPLPHVLLNNPESEYSLDEDMCRVGDTLYVIGFLEIPIIGSAVGLVYLPWIELQNSAADTFSSSYGLAVRSHLDPLEGSLASLFPLLELGSEVLLILRDGFDRPRIRSSFVSDPLAKLLRDGIDQDAAVVIHHELSEPADPSNR